MGIINTFSSAASRLLCSALFTVLLAGCVSTEELYAEYDAANCKFVIEKDTGGTLTLRELVSRSYFPWEPAVYFEFDQSSLDEENMARLDNSIRVLTQFPQLLLGLQGFTDQIGTRLYNYQLSGRRVDEVIAYFEQAGIEPGRISSQPIGEGLAEFGTDKAAARANSRRVELMLLDENGRPVHPAYDLKER